MLFFHILEFIFMKIIFHNDIISNICLCEQDKIKFLFMFIYYID